MLTECFGTPFRVYSTKGFPGLHASTDLTKNLSLHGIRTNIRARERRPRSNTVQSAKTDARPSSFSSTDALAKEPCAVGLAIQNHHPRVESSRVPSKRKQS